jgi:hypothetical protein
MPAWTNLSAQVSNLVETALRSIRVLEESGRYCHYLAALTAFGRAIQKTSVLGASGLRERICPLLHVVVRKTWVLPQLQDILPTSHIL